jgi:acyl-CoA reductase-like NAD-dependent aldehyde dehydrogenase
MKVINPATEEIILDIPEDNRQTLTIKFNSLKKAQPGWSTFGLKQRIKILQNFSDELERQIENLASILTSEVGKPLQQSRNEINGARIRIKWLTENAETYLGEEVMTRSPELVEKISYEPLGVVCNISAWNYPWLVGINVFVTALLAGNTVMYKPSEYASLTGLEMEKLLAQSGLPSDVFQLALGSMAIFLPDPTAPENTSMKDVRSKWYPVSWKWAEKIHFMLPMIFQISSR